MTRPVRRLLLAAVLIVTFVGVGTVFGFFDLSDFINQVQINWTDNEHGGKTLSKVAMEDKVVSFTKSYDVNLAPTIDSRKPYLYKEVKDVNDEVLGLTIMYKCDKNEDEVVSYYQSFYGDVETADLGNMKSIDGQIKDYSVTVSVEAESASMTEVTLMLKK